MADIPRCYLVLGMEGSGTYMMAEALVAAGCTYLYSVNENNDQDAFSPSEDYYVMRRSLPNAGEWPNIDPLLGSIDDARLVAFPVIMMRDFHCATRSITNRGRPPWRARLNALRSLEVMFMPSPWRDSLFVPVQYELLVNSSEYREFIFRRELDIDVPSYKFYDANDKYFGKE